MRSFFNLFLHFSLWINWKWNEWIFIMNKKTNLIQCVSLKLAGKSCCLFLCVCFLFISGHAMGMIDRNVQKRALKRKNFWFCTFYHFNMWLWSADSICNSFDLSNRGFKRNPYRFYCWTLAASTWNFLNACMLQTFYGFLFHFIELKMRVQIILVIFTSE